MGSDKPGPKERYDIMTSDAGHDELMKHELYRRVYEHGKGLIDEGYNPLMVAMALASLVTVIIGGIHDVSSRKRAS